MLGGAQSCAGVNGLKESPAAPVCSITQVQINAPLLPPFPNLFPASRATLLVDHFETNRASFCYLVMAVINEAPTSQDEVLAGVVNRLAPTAYSTFSFQTVAGEAIREDKDSTACHTE